MTTREKSLLSAGLVLGLLGASSFFGVSRLFRAGSSAANTAEMAAPSNEPSSESRQARATTHDHRSSASSESNEPAASVQMTEEEQRSIGLQMAVVQHQMIHHELLAVARVEEPETQLASISARIGGRIDKLHVDFTGQQVRRGQPIAEIYSPEVVTSAEEYKLAIENRKRLGVGAESQAISGADDLIGASRRRLELWGLTTRQIETIATSDKPQIDLTIYSSASGIVTDRRVTVGQYVNTGDILYTLTDLSSVWVKADVYEADLPQLRVGQEVQVSTDSSPDAKLRGRVSFIEPMVNAQTRTTVARIQVANPGMRLRPGMFVRARFAVSDQHSLAVPRSAVVDTGTRKLVYVAKGNGIFESRDVELGPATDNLYPVVSGLRQGDSIVTEGNFLLDSQTRITGGMSGMFGGSKEFDQQSATAESAQWKVTLRSDPATPKGGSDTSLHVSVQDAAGKIVPDAQVQMILFMPAMPVMGMGEMREAATLRWAGSEYVGSIRVPMSGTWMVTVEVSRGGQQLTSYRTSLNAK